MRTTPFLIPIIAALLALPGSAARAEATRDTPVPAFRPAFWVPAVEILETELVDVNTGQKTRLRDGSYNNRYIHRRAGEGMVLLTVRLQIVNLEGLEVAYLGADGVRLHDPDAPDKAPYVPFAWFEDPDWMAPEVIVRIEGKGLAEFAFEVPAHKANRLCLVVDGMTLGRVGDFLPPI